MRVRDDKRWQQPESVRLDRTEAEGDLLLERLRAVPAAGTDQRCRTARTQTRTPAKPAKNPVFRRRLRSGSCGVDVALKVDWALVVDGRDWLLGKSGRMMERGEWEVGERRRRERDPDKDWPRRQQLPAPEACRDSSMVSWPLPGHRSFQPLLLNH